MSADNDENSRIGYVGIRKILATLYAGLTNFWQRLPGVPEAFPAEKDNVDSLATETKPLPELAGLVKTL